MSEPASDVVTRVGDRTLALSNLDKVLYPATGTTKAEVISYYLQVAPTLLPHLADRVVSRLRYPGGVPAGGPGPGAGGSTPVAEGAFWEKNMPVGAPAWAQHQLVRTSDGLVDYVVVDEAATLVWLANLAALELHVPQWRISSGVAGADGVLNLPGADPRPGEPTADRLVVDLDPGTGTGSELTARAAMVVAGRLAADGLVPVPVTSGSKGIQVYAAVAATRSRDVWAYAKQLNAELARRHPDLFVAEMAVAARAGRVYLDYNQNLAARNTVTPYSLRARERPSVAAPLTWEEVAAVREASDLRFRPEQVLDRIADLGDLAADLRWDDPPVVPPPPVA